MHSSTKLKSGWLFAALLFTLSLIVAAGCSKNGNGNASGDGGKEDTALISAGKAIYASNGCAKCHAIGGQGGQKGPDLSKVGAEKEHTSSWLMAYVKNPKSQNPNSRMPSFDNRINNNDLVTLGAYLASLK